MTTPELLALARSEADRLNRSDAILTGLERAIADGRLRQDQLVLYTSHLGDHSAAALIEALDPDRLPADGLTADVAHGTITPMMRDNYRRANRAARSALLSDYQAAGIPLDPVAPDFQAARIEAVEAAAVERYADPALGIESVRTLLTGALANITIAMTDNYLEQNAEIAADVGYRETITRQTDGRCCSWCDDLAGTYDYGSHPPEIFRRHNNCQCTVIFSCKKGRQNSHTKQWYRSESTKSAAKRADSEARRSAADETARARAWAAENGG